MDTRELIRNILTEFDIPITTSRKRVSKKVRESNIRKHDKILSNIQGLMSNNINNVVDTVFRKYDEEVRLVYGPESIENVKTMKKELLLSVNDQVVDEVLKKNMDLIEEINQQNKGGKQIEPNLLDIDYLYSKHQFFEARMKQLEGKLEKEREDEIRNSFSDGVSSELSPGKDSSVEAIDECFQYKKDVARLNLVIP